ncbi:MAG: TolC family protein, partial [Desulfuromonadales bacterium]|nr:TolC family protein [Desulfuromonadales bacterium]
MIARLLLRVLLLVALPVHFSYATEVFVPEVWTARGAIEFALRSNPDSQIARQRLREAEALQTRAAAGFYPQLDLSGAYSQTDNPMHSFGNILNQGAFTPAIDFNDPGRTDNLNLSATVQYRFYNGGQDRARSQAAAAGFDVATAEHEAILRRLEFEVFRSFQQIDEADNINRARLAALDAIRSSLAVARSRYDAGDLLKIDLLNLEVQESQAEENQIQSAHRLELAKKIFLQLLGLDAGEVRIDSAGMETPARPEPPGPVQRPELL